MNMLAVCLRVSVTAEYGLVDEDGTVTDRLAVVGEIRDTAAPAAWIAMMREVAEGRAKLQPAKETAETLVMQAPDAPASIATTVQEDAAAPIATAEEATDGF